MESGQIKPIEPATSTTSNKKTSKGLITTTTIACLLAIAGIGFGVYGLTKASDSNPEVSDLKIQIENQDGTITTLETDEIKINGATDTITITDSYSTDDTVKEIVNKIYDALSENLINQRFYRTFDYGGTIKVSNSDIYTIVKKSYGVISVSQINNHDEIMQKAHPIAQSVLTSNGYKVVKELPFDYELYYNQNNDIYCDITIAASPFSVNCSSEKWLTQQDKDLILALAKAAGTGFVAASSENIQNSFVSPYQRLTGSVGNAAGLFYRVSPDAEWQFFRATQAHIPCSEYTSDAAKAFAGESCYDESTGQNSTVQP